MTQYYLDVSHRRYRPDRRRTTSVPSTERRHQDVESITSEQYTHLRECLNDRQRVKAILGNRERRARHLLYGTTAAFIAYAFASPGFSIDLQGVSITDQQIAALFPLLTAYLIVYACHTGATHLRVRYECKLLDLELQRFGSTTSASVDDQLRALCSPENPSVWTFFSTGAFNLVYWIHDAFLVVSVALALFGSGMIAVATYRSLSAQSPWIAYAFSGYLGFAGLAAIAAPVMLRYARQTRSKAIDEHLRQHRPLKMTQEHKENGARSHAPSGSEGDSVPRLPKPANEAN